MGLITSNQLHLQDAVRQLARDLENAGHGLKGEIKKAFMSTYSMSNQTLHRRLKEVGWSSGRKQRSDAGTTAVSDELLVELSAMKRLGIRENGKETMKTTTASSILHRNGRHVPVGNARLNELMRQRGLNAKTISQPSAHKNMRSLYPNHIHQVDPSYSLLYYAPDGVRRLNDSEAYKNKPDWVKKTGANKLWRYVLTDHYSSFIICKYYKSAGETQAILYDFVQHAWQLLEGRMFHGVPEILLVDKGSANMAGGFNNAMRQLGVKVETHATSASNVKGQVENGNNIIETQFESGLLHEPIHNVDEINEAVFHFCNNWAANTIPNFDSSLNRAGFAGRKVCRADVFSRIRAEQIRLLPDAETCRYLFTNDPIEKPVKADLTVSFKHPALPRTCAWNLRHLSDIAPRQLIVVEPLINTAQQSTAPQILVTVKDYQGNKTTYVAEPVEYDEYSGFALDGPVWGEEYNALEDTPVDKQIKELDRTAYPDMDDEAVKKAKKTHEQPFADKGGLVTHSDLKEIELPQYLQRKGEQIDVPNRVQIDVKPMDEIDIRMALKRKYELVLDADMLAQMHKWYPEGVEEDELDNLANRLTSRPALRVVGDE